MLYWSCGTLLGLSACEIAVMVAAAAHDAWLISEDVVRLGITFGAMILIVSETFQNNGIPLCTFGQEPHMTSVKYDRRRGNRRNRIDTMNGRLKDGCRIETPYDRYASVILPALAPAAVVSDWL